MFSVIVSVKRPREPAKFEDEFWQTHVQLVRKIPHVRKVVVHRVVEVLQGAPDLYGMIEVWCDSREAFDSAKASNEMRAALHDGTRLEEEAGTEMTFNYYCESRET